MKALPCESFEDMFAAVSEGKADLAMVPIENSVAGRVADIHHLMPESGLHIIAEHFQRVNHQLMAPKGATLAGLKTVRSHVQALAQCRHTLRQMGLTPVTRPDTRARQPRSRGRRQDGRCRGLFAAAEIYGLEILKGDMEDAEHNTTRLRRDAKEPIDPDPKSGRWSPASSSRCARCLRRSTRRWGGFATTRQHHQARELHLYGAFTVAQFLRRCRRASGSAVE